MAAKSKAFKVREGNTVLTVAPHAKGWRFGYETPEGWRYITRKKRADIVEEAERVLGEMATGFLWSSLPKRRRQLLEKINELAGRDEELEAAAGFLETLARSEGLAGAVGRFCAFKVEGAGFESKHLSQLRLVLEELVEGFPGKRVNEVGAAELYEWWSTRCEAVGAKRKLDIRTHLVSFWKWSRKEGLHSDLVSVAERLPSPKVKKGEKRILTPAELAALLNEVDVDFRAWAVLGNWAGLRPEEIVPSRETAMKEGRRGLYCEDIDFAFGVIRVPSEVAGKVDTPRIVPMCAALRVGLDWAGIKSGMTGPVVMRDPVKYGEVRRLGKEVFGGKWPQDAPRHSYGSYRNALLRNLGQVAEEMGTSVEVLNAHYHNPQAEAQGRQWFEGLVLNSSDSDGAWIVLSEASDEEKPLKLKGIA